jgi:hypothetical protein
MIDISNSIVSDTVQGAFLLSVFDFVACFFVLYFISFFIRGITYLDERILKPSGESQQPENPPKKNSSNNLPPGSVK